MTRIVEPRRRQRSNPSSDLKFFCNRIQLPRVRGHPPSLILCPPLPTLILISPALSISLSPIRISHPPPPPPRPPWENARICPLLPARSRRPLLPCALPSAEPRMAGGGGARRRAAGGADHMRRWRRGLAAPRLGAGEGCARRRAALRPSPPSVPRRSPSLRPPPRILRFTPMLQIHRLGFRI